MEEVRGMGISAIEIKVAKAEEGYKLNFRGRFTDPKWSREHVAKTDEEVRDLVNKALDQLLRS